MKKYLVDIEVRYHKTVVTEMSDNCTEKDAEELASRLYERMDIEMDSNDIASMDISCRSSGADDRDTRLADSDFDGMRIDAQSVQDIADSRLLYYEADGLLRLMLSYATADEIAPILARAFGNGVVCVDDFGGGLVENSYIILDEFAQRIGKERWDKARPAFVEGGWICE